MRRVIKVEKILITGAAGQLGVDLVNGLKDYELIPSTRENLDITQLEETIDFVSNAKPDVIIHSAARTDVDRCESHPDEAFLVNAVGTRNVAIAARRVNAKLVYISTDYVFDGQKDDPYREFDSPHPLTVYGKSKLLGEEYVKQQLNEFFIVRIAWLYGIHGKNFVKTMLQLAQTEEKINVVSDQRGTPTWTVDVVRQIERLVATEAYGTYHCTSQGSCTWYEFAQEIFKNAGYEAVADSSGSIRLMPNPQNLRFNTQDLGSKTQNLTPITMRPVTSEEFPHPAKRPKNSVLENYMLKLQGFDVMPEWKESLGKFMELIDSQQSTVSGQQPKG